MHHIKRITTRDQLLELQKELGACPDWHENDEVDVTALFAGTRFDNAGFWPAERGSDPERLEMHVILKKEGEPVAAVNLATLLAWATGYGA